MNEPIPFPVRRRPAAPLPELRPSVTVVRHVIADACALVLGQAAEPGDERARRIRVAALAIIAIDETEPPSPSEQADA